MKLIYILLSIILCSSIVSCKQGKKSVIQVEEIEKQDATSVNREIIKEPFVPNAVINFEYTKKVIIRDWKGNELGFMQNNGEEEDYISLNIKKDSLQFFYVKAIAEISKKNIEGWLKKSNYIGTYARNYEEGQSLNLYEEPNNESKIKSIVKEWIPDFYTITKFNNNWVFVKMSYEGKDYSGWLEPKMQCPNSYTTCN